MKNSYRINYIFLLLSIGIVSTVLSNPVSGQTQNNLQNQQCQTSNSTSTYTSRKPDIESAQELESITNDTDTRTSNDTTPLLQKLGEETQSGNQTAGGGQQQGNQTAGGGQQQGNQTAGGGQQQGNQTAGGGQEGNQSDNPLSNVGKAIGDLFK